MSVFLYSENKVSLVWKEKYAFEERKFSTHFGLSTGAREFWVEGCLEKPCLFFLTVFKHNPKPAKAIIEVTVNGPPLRKMEVDEWAEHCTFQWAQGIEGPENGSKVLINVECTITWLGLLPDYRRRVFNLYRNMRDFFMSEEFSDIKIVIGKQELPAHKVVLASQSPVLLRMLRSGMKESTENRIVIEDIATDVMTKVLEFLYNGKIPEDADYEIVCELLVAAEKYEILTLKSLCEYFLSDNMTVENVLTIYKYSSTYNSPYLVRKAKNLIRDNQHHIMLQDEFVAMSEKSPKLLDELSSVLFKKFKKA